MLSLLGALQSFDEHLAVGLLYLCEPIGGVRLGPILLVVAGAIPERRTILDVAALLSQLKNYILEHDVALEKLRLAVPHAGLHFFTSLLGFDELSLQVFVVFVGQYNQVFQVSVL